MEKINVLINAYAVSPNWGSEQGMGWNWIISISKYCEVYVITEGEWQIEIENELNIALSAKHPNISKEQAKRMHFFYCPVSENIRRMCWNQGDWRFYYYYDKWQHEVYKKASEIISQYKIDIIHQLNMVGFREPGQLWRIKEIPFIWGPFCGCSPIKLSFFNNLDYKDYLKLKIKNALNNIQFKYFYKVKSAMKRADALLTTDPNIQKLVFDFYGKTSFIIQETGLQKGCIEIYERKHFESKRLNILWVGRFIKTKKLDIALKTMSLLRGKDIHLHIVGFGLNGEEKLYQEMANELGVNDMCTWYGKMDNSKVKEIMKCMDLFFFTSVLEATSTVIPEAIQNRLPILCHDTCGFGPIINDSIGRKIQLVSPEYSVREFAALIEHFYNNKNELKDMLSNFDVIAENLTFEAKAKFISNLYIEILSRK